MIKKIEKDHTRFRDIVRGHIKKDLKKYITNGEMIGRKGKYTVSIPIPQINIPRFKYGNKKSGVGQGDGDIGTSVGQGDQTNTGQAGDAPGNHILEVELTFDELAQILGEALELPRIKPKGRNVIVAEKHNFTGISRVGPEGLRHFKRTYKEALKRALITGMYDPKNPFIIPVREDKRFRAWKSKEVPQNNAVIIYMMDVSGSMGEEQKAIIRSEAFWIDAWLKSQYKKLETRYIVHDADAKEVSKETFFHLKESGGTKISSAYKVCLNLIKEHYNSDDWNIYPFHFSDGDNWGTDDTADCIELLRDSLFPLVNVFCYGQVKSAYGSGQFKKDLEEHFKDDERLITNEIADHDGILDSIKGFLGKGK